MTAIGTKLLVLSDFCLAAGRDVAQGDVLTVGQDLDPKRARQIIALRFAEPVEPDEDDGDAGDGPEAGGTSKKQRTSKKQGSK